MTRTAYRICKARHAASIWSGEGARRHGGRWNSKGVAVVYASESRALAAMEQLVHLVKPRVLMGFVVAGVEFDDRHVRTVYPSDLPAGWDNPVAPPELRFVGDEWAVALTTPVLAVPSAVVPGEWNYLLNPSHDAFQRLRKKPPVPFAFDARLA